MLRFFTSAVCCLAVVVLAGCGGGSSGSAPISVGGPPVLYVTTSSNTIAGFQISSAGVLTPVVGSPFANNGSGTEGIATANSSFLYVANSASQNISAY